MAKIYLLPGPVRKGQPTTLFVEKDKNGYWLGIYHTRSYTAISGALAYDAVSRERITPALYQSFVTEAHHNSAKYMKGNS